MPPLDPDILTRISLIGTAERLHFDQVGQAAALAELRRVARGRVDLLSDAAGHFLGSGTWNAPACHQLLLAAGATDQARIHTEADRVRKNRSVMGHNSAGIIR